MFKLRATTPSLPQAFPHLTRFKLVTWLVGYVANPSVMTGYQGSFPKPSSTHSKLICGKLSDRSREANTLKTLKIIMNEDMIKGAVTRFITQTSEVE
jgi:hypothetical protein